MLDTATMVYPALNHVDRRQRHILTTDNVHMGTQPAASRLPKSAAGIGMKETCMTLFATEIHTIGLKTITKKEIASSSNDVRRGTMITIGIEKYDGSTNLAE
jgi:hypothetical protein